MNGEVQEVRRRRRASPSQPDQVDGKKRREGPEGEGADNAVTQRLACWSLGRPRTRTASTMALSALSRPSRATRRAIGDEVGGFDTTRSLSMTHECGVRCRVNLTRLVSSLYSSRCNVCVRPMAASKTDLYFISVAARMLGMHPQTLRKYERLGLVQPSRTIGSMRLYSRDELRAAQGRSSGSSTTAASTSPASSGCCRLPKSCSGSGR